MNLPITDPVLIVALAMGLFLLAPLLFERLRVPGIIGLIVAGAVVGPYGLGLLARDPTIVLLGTVGLLYLVFLAGLELDLHRFTQYRRQSISFGLLSFGLPMALSVAVMPLLGFGIPGSILMGSVIGSHTLLAYPIVSRLGLVKPRRHHRGGRHARDGYAGPGGPGRGGRVPGRGCERRLLPARGSRFRSSWPRTELGRSSAG